MEGLVRLQLLGTVQVERDGEPLRGFRSRKALAVLGSLAVQGQPVPRERLADLFWPDLPEAQGRANLSWVLHRISSLVPDCLQADRHSLRFQPQAPYWLDLDAFEELRVHGDPGSLLAAVELARGEFLEGLYLEGCAEFELWLVAERERWRQRVACALETLVAHHSHPAGYDEALRFARHLLALEPWREQAHRQLMRLYAWSGERAAALRQYAECERVLEEKLGVRPDEETTLLYQAIHEGRELPPPVHPTPAGRVHPQVAHNLPMQLTPFVGRKSLLAEIRARLQDPACRLLSLVGPGGSGKTRLALEAAAGLLSDAGLEEYAHGIFFVPLGPLDLAEAIVPTVARALGFSFYAGGGPASRQLLDYLRQKSLLLLMDSFEHLLAGPEPGRRDGVGWVTEVLQTAPQIKILATSRARLNVEGEYLVPVPGMEVPDAGLGQDAVRYSAVELFLQGARRVQPSFGARADHLADVTRICRLVAGMPLGILLAAGWMDMLTPAEIADRISGQRAGELGQGLDFLETDLSDVPARQRSMRAVFDHSWNLLTERQRAVMQALSVFCGGFTQEAAGHVAGATRRGLRALVHRSLLQRDPGSRYEMHELLRQYAADRLRRAQQLRGVPGEREAAKDRHCAYYAGYLQQREPALVGKDQRQVLAEIEVEIDNVQAAWNWAVARGKVAELDRSLQSLAEFYRLRSRFQEGEEAFARAVRMLAGLHGQSACQPRLRRRCRLVTGRALSRQGLFCFYLHRREEAAGLLGEAVAHLRDLDARRETAYALFWLGLVAQTFEGTGESAFREALTMFKEIGDRRGFAFCLRGLGRVKRCKGEMRAAKQLCQESLAICRELGNQADIATALRLTGFDAFTLGDYEEARQLGHEALALCKEIGDRQGIGETAETLGCAALGLRDYAEARQVWQEGLALSREMGGTWGIAGLLHYLAELANVLGDYAEGMRLGQESLAHAQRLDRPRAMGLAWRVLGEAACGLGDLCASRRYFRRALEATKADWWAFRTPFILVGIAGLLAAEGETARAVELLTLVLHHRSSWQWIKDRATALGAELEAELPPEVVAAAQERGRARDLDATVAELLVELADPGAPPAE